MSTVQKWLTGLVGLGALYLVAMKPESFKAAGTAFENVTGGTIAKITTGGKAS